MQWFGISLGTENTKLGPVFSFSLPSKITCPGASPWCEKHCYASRYERRRPNCRNAYQRNYDLAQNTEEFSNKMIKVLPRLLPCFRMHVSGDFFSRDYTECWYRICTAFPSIAFWGYTRSWTVPDMLPSLEQLRNLHNVQLFASLDPTMPDPPGNWRVAYIDNDPQAKGIPCKEQTGEAKSCLDCGYCFLETTGNVVFQVR